MYNLNSIITFLPALLFILLNLTSKATACTDISNVKVTFYGYPDNSPPGAGTAYNCGGRNNIAGGSGSYSDPVTFATAPGEFSKCEIIYIPYLRKYGRFEDTCEQCTTDWKSGQYHIDIWTGSSTSNGGSTQITCEDDLTPDKTESIVRYPGTSYNTQTAALFASGTCNTKYTYKDNEASNYC